jgi:hypothetical protein
MVPGWQSGGVATISRKARKRSRQMAPTADFFARKQAERRLAPDV